MKFNKGPDLRLVQPQVQEDYAVLAHVLDLLRIQPEPLGWALEFGVATGKTLAMIADVLPVIGFDSFEGLPEDWRDEFKAGHFNGVRPPRDIPNSTLVEGLFSETVPGYDWPDTISLIHLDADLYSSTKTVLDAVMDHADCGTILVFDEFFGYDGCKDHEQRAWDEWCNDGRYVDWAVIGHGREQWAIEITAI